MRRFIITGAPGAGKTAIIRQLELDGFSVVEEAATDISAAAHAQGTVQPWMDPAFIDAIARLQRDRQIRACCQPDEIQFHDRSAVCTAALAIYLGHSYTPLLASELERIKKESLGEASPAFASSAALPMFKPKARAQSATPVGQYAIQLSFSDGHSTGIYSYDHLRSICPCPECTAQRTQSIRA